MRGVSAYAAYACIRAPYAAKRAHLQGFSAENSAAYALQARTCVRPRPRTRGMCMQHSAMTQVFGSATGIEGAQAAYWRIQGPVESGDLQGKWAYAA